MLRCLNSFKRGFPFPRSPFVLLIPTLAANVVPMYANPFYGDQGSKTPANPVVTPSPFAGVQSVFKDRLASAFADFGANPSFKTITVVLAVAFLYGMLHAAGPGHRKTVIFSLFLGQKARAWEPLAAGFLSAGIHAASGGGILLVLSLVRGALVSLARTERFVVWVDGITLCVLGGLALFLIIRAIPRLRRGSAEGEAADTQGKSLYSILAVSSLVPCPGAIMVLLFALYMDALPLGLAAFVSLSLGMGLVVSAAGYLAWFGRDRLFKSLKAREKTITRVSAGFEMASYLLILVFALYTAWPFIASLLA